MLGGRVNALFRIMLRRYRQKGLAGVWESSIEGLRRVRGHQHAQSAFDHRYDTDTAGTIPLWKLKIESPYQDQGVRYQPSDPGFVQDAIEKLPIRAEEFIFIDIGSGKGLTLLVACEFPFRQIIGVEFSAELHAIAVDNIRKRQRAKARCEHVSSVLADAADYEFPIEDTIIFLYNPFGEVVFKRMLENLERSLKKFDRRIYIIYSNPEFENLLGNCGFVEKLAIQVSAVVYVHVPKIIISKRHDRSPDPIFGKDGSDIVI